MRALLQDRLRTDARTGTGTTLRIGLWLGAGVVLWLVGLARRPQSGITVEEARNWGELALWGLTLVQSGVVWFAAPWVVAQDVLEDREQGLERAISGAVRPARAQATRVFAAVWPVVAAAWAAVPAMAMTTLLGTSIWAVLSGLLGPLVTALGLGAVALVVAQRVEHRWTAVAVAWLVAAPVWFLPAPFLALFNWDWRHMAEVAPWAAAWLEHPAWWLGWLVGLPLFTTSIDVAATVGVTGPQAPTRVAYLGRSAWNLPRMALLFTAWVLAFIFPVWIGVGLIAAPAVNPIGTYEINGAQIPYWWLAIPARAVVYGTLWLTTALWVRLGLMFSLDLAFHLSNLPDVLRGMLLGQGGDTWQKATLPWLWPTGPMARWIGREPSAAASATLMLLSGLALTVGLLPVVPWMPAGPAVVALLTACCIAAWVAHGGSTAEARASLEVPGMVGRVRWALLVAGLALAGPALVLAWIGRLVGQLPTLGDAGLPLVLDLALFPGFVLAAAAWGRWAGRLGLGRALMLVVAAAACFGIVSTAIWLDWAPDELQQVLVVIAALPRSLVDDPVPPWAHVSALGVVWSVAISGFSTALLGRR